MPETSRTFSTYSGGDGTTYNNGVYTPSMSGDASVFIVGSGLSINVGDTVTFYFGNSSLPATYDGYYSDGTTRYPLITVNDNYYLLGETAAQSYAITQAAYTQKTVNCFARGTRILTVSGEVAVEALQAGDLVVTFAGRGASLKPIRWLGHSRIDLRRHPDRATTDPVRIRAGALGEQCPHRDLVVSPGHRMRIDGELVIAQDLVNGASIVQESPDEAEYWHIELDEHDLVLADGMQAETYQDIGNRGVLENNAVAMLNPVLDGDVSEPCLPYATVSADMRARLIDRAEKLGWTRTFDAAPWLEVDGKRIDPVRHEARCRFSLPPNCQTVRLRSRAVRPWDADAQSTDKRHLGLKLHRLALDGPGGMWEVPLVSPTLDEGFNAVERDADGWIWRWTTGNALLDLTNLTGGETITAVEIDYNQALPMWIEPAVQEIERAAPEPRFTEANVWALTG